MECQEMDVLLMRAGRAVSDVDAAISAGKRAVWRARDLELALESAPQYYSTIHAAHDLGMSWSN
jgi:hypothetical protein